MAQTRVRQGGRPKHWVLLDGDMSMESGFIAI
jgi:hypothetical protein